MFALFHAGHFIHLPVRFSHLQHVRKRFEPYRRRLDSGPLTVEGV